MLILGNCIEELDKLIKNKTKVDLVLTDLPYGITANQWDIEIPMEDIWPKLIKLLKPKGVVLFFGIEPFSSKLRLSAPVAIPYKYDWIWVKDPATNFLNARRQPLRKTEHISVFYQGQCHYQPQLHKKQLKDVRPTQTNRPQHTNYGKMNKLSTRTIPITLGYPSELLKFTSCVSCNSTNIHPTEKPVALLEYLINTYTKPKDLVLDFTMGSGSTGVATVNTSRRFIGVELNPVYFEIARNRISQSALAKIGEQ